VAELKRFSLVKPTLHPATSISTGGGRTTGIGGLSAILPVPEHQELFSDLRGEETLDYVDQKRPKSAGGWSPAHLITHCAQEEGFISTNMTLVDRSSGCCSRMGMYP
jgi:hypothetical protein